MNYFNELVAIADQLFGPGGCPWVQEQTLKSLEPLFLEEVHELLEAIDLQDVEKIKEELGDCFFILLFIGKLGEKNRSFTLPEALHLVAQKLIRRHPHVFCKEKNSSIEDVLQSWEEIKKREGKKNPIDGIPDTLPALARAQKVIGKVHRAEKKALPPTAIASEEELGRRLWDLVSEGEAAGFDAESALRRFTKSYEASWRT